MPLPPHVVRFWRAVDDQFGSVTRTPWGAVVTDGRFPAIWDANYARIDVPSDEIALGEVAQELAPALRSAGADVFHVVCFEPRPRTGILAELVALGQRVTWDAVLQLDRTATVAPCGTGVVEVPPSPDLWRSVEATMELFGVDDPSAVRQLRRIEEEVLAPRSKRWFGVREDGELVALAAMMLLEGVGYVDNVATFPRARGKGYATALTTRIVREARSAGAEQVILFADPDAPAVLRLYERLGFREVGRLAATKGPVPSPG